LTRTRMILYHLPGEILSNFELFYENIVLIFHI